MAIRCSDDETSAPSNQNVPNGRADVAPTPETIPVPKTGTAKGKSAPDLVQPPTGIVPKNTNDNETSPTRPDKTLVLPDDKPAAPSDDKAPASLKESISAPEKPLSSPEKPSEKPPIPPPLSLDGTTEQGSSRNAAPATDKATGETASEKSPDESAALPAAYLADGGLPQAPRPDETKSPKDN
jgi:hypothetical protein